MRSRWLCCAAGLFTLVLGSAASASEPASDAVAEVERILKVTAEAPAFRPGLFGSCELSPSPDDRSFHLWCRRCQESGKGWSADFRFFPDPGRGVCTLQQVEMSVDDMGLLEPVSRHLAAAWGHEPRPTPFAHADQLYLSNPVGIPSGWRLSGSQAWLYRNDEETDTVRFLWRNDLLVEVLRSKTEDWDKSRRVVMEACREAHGGGCEALAEHRCYDQDTPAPETPFRASLTLLAATKPDDPSLPAQLYWTKWLGECVASRDYSDDSQSAASRLNEKFPELVGVQSSFGPGGWKGESVEFHSPFRARLIESHQNVRWGRQAFLESLDDWNGYAEGCNESGFAPVNEAILAAEDFLRRYPETETSDDVRLLLASAYETWWSISRSGNETGDLFPEDQPIALAGGETAKQQALTIYRRLAARPTAGSWFKDKIFRLEHNIDTFERSHYCSQC